MSNRTVPEPSQDSLPIAGLQDLQSHLAAIEADPAIPFNAKLFDDVELQLTDTNIPPLLPVLLQPLTSVFKATTQDRSPLLPLAIKLLSPLPFSSLFTIVGPSSILDALQSLLPEANLLGLVILHKAAATPADAALLSTVDSMFLFLLTIWLETPDTGIAEKAGKVLGDLLTVDCKITPVPVQVNGTEPTRAPRPPGTGKLWKHFFDMSSLILHDCRATTRSARELSLSQGRVLRLLPRLAALDIHALTHPSPEYVFDQGRLLQWAALEMVDRGDALMRLNLVGFFEELVSVMRVAENRTPETDADLKMVVQAAVAGGDDIRDALRSLPDRTVEEEAEPLRAFVRDLLD